MTTITSTAITHYGAFNDTSRQTPALAFFEKYNAAVISCQFSEPSQTWFADSCDFYFNNGATLHSGFEIWEWMKSPKLFGHYAKLEPTNMISTVILGGHEKGDRLIHQQDMVFFPKQGSAELREKGIPVRRTLEFVSGPAEVEGQGTDGLQYFVGKTFWDTNVLALAEKKDSL